MIVPGDVIPGVHSRLVTRLCHGSNRVPAPLPDHGRGKQRTVENGRKTVERRGPAAEHLLEEARCRKKAPGRDAGAVRTKSEEKSRADPPSAKDLEQPRDPVAGSDVGIAVDLESNPSGSVICDLRFAIDGILRRFQITNHKSPIANWPSALRLPLAQIEVDGPAQRFVHRDLRLPPEE